MHEYCCYSSSVEKRTRGRGDFTVLILWCTPVNKVQMYGWHFTLNQITPFWVNLCGNQELHLSCLDKFLHKVEKKFRISLGRNYGRMFCVFPWVRTREWYIECVLVQELGQDILCMSRVRTRDWYLCKSLGQRWRKIFCVWPRVRARQGYVIYVFSGTRDREGHFCILEKDVLWMA